MLKYHPSYSSWESEATNNLGFFFALAFEWPMWKVKTAAAGLSFLVFAIFFISNCSMVLDVCSKPSPLIRLHKNKRAIHIVSQVIPSPFSTSVLLIFNLSLFAPIQSFTRHWFKSSKTSLGEWRWKEGGGREGGGVQCLRHIAHTGIPSEINLTVFPSNFM